MLAGELALHGVRALVLEQRTGPNTEQRANGVVGQVVRMLERCGLYQRLAGTSERRRTRRGRADDAGRAAGAAHRVLGVPLEIGPPTGDGPHLLRRSAATSTRLADRYREGRVLLTTRVPGRRT